MALRLSANTKIKELILRVRKVNLSDANCSVMLYAASGKEAIMVNPQDAKIYQRQGWLTEKPSLLAALKAEAHQVKAALNEANEALGEVSESKAENDLIPNEPPNDSLIKAETEEKFEGITVNPSIKKGKKYEKEIKNAN